MEKFKNKLMTCVILQDVDDRTIGGVIITVQD